MYFGHFLMPSGIFFESIIFFQETVSFYFSSYKVRHLYFLKNKTPNNGQSRRRIKSSLMSPSFYFPTPDDSCQHPVCGPLDLC